MGGLTQALGSIENSSHIAALKFALTFIGIGTIVHGFDQWLVYRHISDKVDLVAILNNGIYGLGLLAVVATISFLAGLIASKRNLKQTAPYTVALTALVVYLAVNYMAQHIGYALLSMSAAAFIAPFLASKAVANAA